MGVPIPRTLQLQLLGSSLTAGRLETPDNPWHLQLLADMKRSPYCKGPVSMINIGQGSQTSNFGVTQSALFAPLRPDYVLTEDFGINDCAIGPVTLPQAAANLAQMIANYQTANPDVVICHQTMSPASAGDGLRGNLAAYYTQATAIFTAHGLQTLDHYADWPKPLPVNLTVAATAFQIPPTPGYLGVASGATLDPAHKDARIALSNANLTGTFDGSTAKGTALCTAPATGQTHFEASVGPTLGLGYPVLGVCTAAATLAGATPGDEASSLGFSQNGNVYAGGAIIGTHGITMAAGDRLAVEFDPATKLAYLMKGTTRSAGFSFAAAGAGPFYPAVGLGFGYSITAMFAEVQDGLHPVWANAFQLYSYPTILAWAQQIMRDFWP